MAKFLTPEQEMQMMHIISGHAIKLGEDVSRHIFGSVNEIVDQHERFGYDREQVEFSLLSTYCINTAAVIAEHCMACIAGAHLEDTVDKGESVKLARDKINLMSQLMLRGLSVTACRNARNRISDDREAHGKARVEDIFDGDEQAAKDAAAALATILSKKG